MITLETFAQIDTVYGNAYRYLKPYKDNSPFISSTFVFEKITGEEYFDAYDILSVEKKVKKKVLRYGIWLVDSDNHFYVNVMHHGYKDMFIKFEKSGNYYYFIAEPQSSVVQQQRTYRILYICLVLSEVPCQQLFQSLRNQIIGMVS